MNKLRATVSGAHSWKFQGLHWSTVLWLDRNSHNWLVRLWSFLVSRWIFFGQYVLKGWNAWMQTPAASLFPVWGPNVPASLWVRCIMFRWVSYDTMINAFTCYYHKWLVGDILTFVFNYYNAIAWNSLRAHLSSEYIKIISLDLLVYMLKHWTIVGIIN